MTQSRLITQIDYARAGKITPQMEAVAAKEHKTPEEIRAGVAKGCIAIPANIQPHLWILSVGWQRRTELHSSVVRNRIWE